MSDDYGHFFWTAFWVVVTFVIAALVMFLSFLAVDKLVTPARGHSWYPEECCGSTDCHPAECEQLEELKDGHMTWHGPGFDLHYNKEMVRPSRDSQCHVCPHCVFIRPTS